MSVATKLYFKLKRQIHLFGCDSLKRFNRINPNNLKGSRILVYHGIDVDDNRTYNSRFISQSRFTKHLLAFRKHFHLVSLDSILNNEVDPEVFNVALTFDDGYKNNASHALPILERFNVPATFCVTAVSDTTMPILWTDYLDIVASEFKKNLVINGVAYTAKKKHPWSHREYVDAQGISLKWLTKRSSLAFINNLKATLAHQVSLDRLMPYAMYWQQLTRDEIETLANHPLVNIANHGYSHGSLAALDHQSACVDMDRSSRYLDVVTKRKINTFAYPDGSYTTDLVDHGKSIGLAHHLITNYSASDHTKDPAIVPRMTINPYISTHNQIRAIIKGSYYGAI